MKKLWFDTETFSAAELRSTGAHSYAEHPTTEIIVAQWAIDDQDPVVEDLTEAALPSAELIAHLNNPEVLVVAHNSAFDRTVVRHVWGIDVPAWRWLDTMVQAYAHGLPGGLGVLSTLMGLPADQAKDKRGRELIMLFCKPRPRTVKLRRADRTSHPEAWLDFLEYARQDIIAMRALFRKLPAWNFAPGSAEHMLWVLDQHINDRGFQVDTVLAQNALQLVACETLRIKHEVRDATDGLVSGFNCPAALLQYILDTYQVSLPDMTADTLRRRIEDPELPDGVRLLLSLRLEGGKASAAKYKALLSAVSMDGRLRGTLQFAGASRTGRWAGRIFQPQNMPRPTMKEEEIARGVEAIRAGAADLVYTNTMDLASNAIRGCIVAPPGKKLVVADLANIEGRVLAWLAGEEWKLRAFRAFDAGTGPDLYKVAYGRAFNVDAAATTKPQRQIGKVMELALGYQGAVGAFLTFASVYQMDLEQLAVSVQKATTLEALERAAGMLDWVREKGRSTYGLSDEVYIACEVIKAGWREAHEATVALWAAAEAAMREAITHPGEVFSVGQHLRMRVDGSWLRVRLPSGRYVCYLKPGLDKANRLTYWGQNPYKRTWGALNTYGGKLVENWTQAVARDTLAANMHRVDLHYPIVLTVHDEIITEVPDDPAFNEQELVSMMTTIPSWATGLPLAAQGFSTYRYKKD